MMRMLSLRLALCVIPSVSSSLLAACGESSSPSPELVPWDGGPGTAGDAASGSAFPGSDAAAGASGAKDASSATGVVDGSSTMPLGDASSASVNGDAGPSGGTSPNGADAGPVMASDGGGATAADAGSVAAACTGAPLSVGDHEYTIQSKNGQKYTYILSIPSTVDPAQRAPVIVHWHALSSDPEEARKVTSIDAKAAAAKAIVVFPRSPDKSWDVGECCTTVVGGTRRDEEVFARELVKDVVSKACVDERRIYTNGFSNGGMISQMLACKMPDVFAASAPLGSTLTSPKAECKPSRPVPIFMLNGTADPLVGYDSPGTSGGISVPEDVKFWATTNGCTGEPETFLTKGKVKCTRYTHCSAGVEVAHCAVDGMGHCVPGMKTESASNCMTKTAFGLLPIQLGMPNDDVDALQMDMDFLLRFTLP
jgi:polyhydroxybutyrate depolymerase